MSKLQSIKYFNDCEPLVPSKLTNTSRIQYEKIKLEFSILHANIGSYSIQAKLYDKQVFDFFSEEKKIHSKQKIIFDKFLICDFYFEKEQNFQIILFKNRKPFYIKTTLGAIIGAKNCTFINNYSGDESLIVKAEKLEKDEELLDIKFILKHNSIPNYFVNNEVYYFITSQKNDIYKSAEIKSDGTFEPIHIPVTLLQPYYTVSFYNLQNQLLFSFKRATHQVKSKEIFQKQFRFSNNTNSYLIITDNSQITKNYTFIDYVKSGVKIALSIGIDFTGSNGHPLDEGSLHSIKGENDYERAIKACGSVVAYYDYDQLFPVFGFGAIINGSGKNEASMCFNLNFSNNPDIYGVEKIIKAYRDYKKKKKLTFSGPTEFAPLISKVVSRINRNDLLEYHILMILTDGVIDDLQKTIDVLVEASFLPLSVIIIGIGEADFSKMEILDGDEVPLTSSSGKKRMRDLVQFVPFYKFQNNEEKLSMEVLAEIPRQMIEFYQVKNLNPRQIENLTKNQNGIINNVNHNFNKTFMNTNAINAINIRPQQNQNILHYDNVRNNSNPIFMDNTRNNPHPQNMVTTQNYPPPPPSSYIPHFRNNIDNNQIFENIPNPNLQNFQSVNSRPYNTSRNNNNNSNRIIRNSNIINANRINNIYQNNQIMNNSYQQNDIGNTTVRNFNGRPNMGNIYNNNINYNQRVNGNMSNRNNGYNNRMNNSNFNEINLNNLSIHETIQLNKSNNPKRK